MKQVSQKKLTKIVANLFYTQNEPWWLIGFSMLMASGIMIEPQLICAALAKGQLSDMWLYWSAIIGSSFSVSFFAHLWRKVPVKTENEFLFFRYSGKGAKVLHTFRSLYLGLLIIPFLISFSILAFSKIVCFITDIELRLAIILATLLLVLLTFYNSLKSRLKMDFVLFIVFMTLFCIITFNLFENIGGLSHLAITVKSSKINFSIIPSIGSKTFNAFIIFILVQWWSASILDYPDMNGQKLMATNSNNDLVKSVFLPSLFIILFRVLLFTLPFLAVCYGFTNGITDSELAFTNLFVKVLPSWMLVLVVILFLIPFISLTQNMQNWGGSLLIENFYKHTINPHINDCMAKSMGIVTMIYIVGVAGCISIYAESLVGITKYLFAITAGVGPVFMLRWYWWRINAWSQLSAMVAALVYPPILDALFENNATVNHFITSIEHTYNIEYYPIKILILTIAVCLTWLVVTFLTAPTATKTLETFASTIKPGGFWKRFNNSGNTFSKLRVLAWLLQTGNGFLLYFIFWNFLVGNYILFIGLLLLFVLGFFVSYKLIQKANANYDLELGK
ncbi:MAG: sodium:solute symporter family transporter [Flavobacterium sp.]|uniref:sodium:solute symporter family transporter n=1 Tax=Flavobacterium sp. TaxID=239 RepID=UPI003BDE1C9D